MLCPAKSRIIFVETFELRREGGRRESPNGGVVSNDEADVSVNMNR